MSDLSEKELLEILVARHNESMFIWNAVDTFICSRGIFLAHGEDVIDLQYWQTTLARVDEIVEQEPRLDDFWATVGKAYSFPSLCVFASSAHALLVELASLLDIEIGLSALIGPAREGLEEGPTTIPDIPAEVFRERFLAALKKMKMVKWETSQKLNVALQREFAAGKQHLDVLRRELRHSCRGDESYDLEQDATGPAIETVTQNDELPPAGWDIPLSMRSQEALEALLELNACDSDRRVTTQDVVEKAVGKNVAVRPYRDVIRDLRDQGYVNTKGGRGGGLWLSEKGLHRAKKLRDS